MLGLAAIAAMAAMAFVGAGSAMATGNTALCNTNTTPCTSLTGPLHFVSVAEPELVTTTPNLTIKCLSGLGTGTAEGLSIASGKPAGVTVNELLWTGCYTVGSPTHNCTVTTEVKGLIDVLKSAAANLGTATALLTKVKVVCGAIISCAYGGAETTGLKVEGALHPAPGTNSKGLIEAPGISVPIALPGICPKTSVWTAKYESLAHIFVTT